MNQHQHHLQKVLLRFQVPYDLPSKLHVYMHLILGMSYLQQMDTVQFSSLTYLLLEQYNQDDVPHSCYK